MPPLSSKKNITKQNVPKPRLPDCVTYSLHFCGVRRG